VIGRLCRDEKRYRTPYKADDIELSERKGTMNILNRRAFLAGTGVTLAGAAVSSPALG
jgi:hypothetical protein